jgi:hypothetical protein
MEDDMPDFSDHSHHPIGNAGSQPNGDMRRSGGSPNDPHGGHENIETEWKSKDPDPVGELVPGGSGSVPPSIEETTETETLAFTDVQEPNLPTEETDADAGVHRLVPGPGRLQEPVEGADNLFVIDPITGLPQLKA